ncbi:2OG-Fe dioxygenase family protein [Roseomonas sp. SSH11]|uniref:2OG-Fe dioxygenase family protein n=1 Tax=Pararoseomonas baculiformis TaxID=2820812 RepID=A0ABS4ABV4_9PROT|nr:2OG-Fe dioxygenase family protein [Pararoseomonas baculiformis]MBP0443978.1 2OG-Fe dioxygenase family protein [Pararoseomonas baculiformis]
MTDLAGPIAEAGFVPLSADEVRSRFDPPGLALSGEAWARFAASWDDLRPDTYMADGGRYRLRRHAIYGAAPGAPLMRAPHGPHFQATRYNNLNGGIDRWFEPVAAEVGEGPALQALLAGARGVFDQLAPGAAWHVEVHQFRIEARPDEAGKPTPEGMHSDGVDYVMVMMIGRENVEGGVTGIQIDGQEKASFTLSAPCDAVLLDDRRVMHGVTPIRPIDPHQPGHRDVLVLTFRWN